MGRSPSLTCCARTSAAGKCSKHELESWAWLDPPSRRASQTREHGRSRRGGRVVECAGLEIRYTVIPYRGFESLPLRQDGRDASGCHVKKKPTHSSRLFSLCG